jgi:alkylated DNA repair dioxygenase AlkB
MEQNDFKSKRKLFSTTTETRQQGKKSKLDVDEITSILRIPRIALTPESWIDVMDVPNDIALTTDEFSMLWDMKPKERGTIKMFGKTVKVPRYEQTFDQDYTYAGVKHKSLPMIPLLQRLMDWSRQRAPSLNGCLVNWYEDCNDYIGFHSDSESSIVPNSEIHSYSFGATRDFVFQSKNTKCIDSKISLTDRTLVAMGGTCQKTHTHSIPKSKIPKGKRINITFRSFIAMK